MPGILKPDTKALVWAAIGFLVLPVVVRTVTGFVKK